MSDQPESAAATTEEPTRAEEDPTPAAEKPKRQWKKHFSGKGTKKSSYPLPHAADEHDDDVEEELKQESLSPTAEVLAAMATLHVVGNDDMVRHVHNFRNTYMKEKRKKKQAQANLYSFFTPPGT